jgi:hypothetical protein
LINSFYISQILEIFKRPRQIPSLIWFSISLLGGPEWKGHALSSKDTAHYVLTEGSRRTQAPDLRYVMNSET